jgi:hypothetical protein
MRCYLDLALPSIPYPGNPCPIAARFLFKVFSAPTDKLKQPTKYHCETGHEGGLSKEAKASGI